MVVQAAKFLRTEHHGIYRKLVTSGLLASFNKSKENMSPIANNNSTEKLPKTPEVVIKTHKNSKNGKKVRQMKNYLIEEALFYNTTQVI